MRLRSAGQVAACAALGYAAGHFPSADLVAGDAEPRRRGSRNPGAANVANLAGPSAGAAVFLLDMAKALGPGLIGCRVAGAVGANAAASAAVIGHCFPWFPRSRRGRGGKGVAASFGQMLATFPIYLPVDVGLAVATARSDRWKQRPVATVVAICSLWTGLGALAARGRWPNLWAPVPGPEIPVAAAVSSAAIIARFLAEHEAADR